MNSDERESHVSRYAGLNDDTVSDDDNEDSLCVGYRRQASGLAFMVDFRLRTGDRRALNYSHVIDASETGGTTFTITFSTAIVTISGRRLTEAYERFIEQRVSWFREADRNECFTAEGEGSALVESITVEDR